MGGGRTQENEDSPFKPRKRRRRIKARKFGGGATKEQKTFPQDHGLINGRTNHLRIFPERE